MPCDLCQADREDCPCRYHAPCAWCGRDDDVRVMHGIGRRWMCQRCVDYYGAEQVAALTSKQHQTVH